MQTIFTLRVHKKTAGRDFPFDRVYLCTLEAQPLIERMFRYALVLPVQGALKSMMEKLVIEQYSEVQSHKYKAEDKIVDDPLVKLMESERDLLCIVPIRGTVYKKDILPNYMTHQSWLRTGTRRQRNLAETPFTRYSYLLTPKDKIQPICVACPNLINHENGECELGDSICLENLPLGVENHFSLSERAPEGENVKEEDYLPPPSNKI